MADSPEDDLVLKRKRVAHACQTCRSMKAKCDGKQPECSRCKGYGYDCVYRARRNQRHRTAHIGTADIDTGYIDTGHVGVSGTQRSDVGQPHKQVGELRGAIDQYETLLDRIVPDLPEARQRDACTSRSSIKALVDRNIARIESSLKTTHLEIVTASHVTATSGTSDQSQRYLGEVSDVRFFNLVKRVLQTKSMSNVIDQEFDSYEQGGDMSHSSSVAHTGMALPRLEEVDQFIDIYFSTIHLAYPFVPQSVFRKNYEIMKGSPEDHDQLDKTWLALLYVICAIGAYYISFPGHDPTIDKLHEVYFLRALSLAPPAGADRSINQLSVLLAQCLYFLAVCKTDSCWTTLGLAVRTAQSMGLHTENWKPEIPEGSDLFEAEKRRRVWYSIYVLDRLLSLQLGRPPAIHDEDCHVRLPSRVADLDIDGEFADPAALDQDPSTGDYFLVVIDFSRIVGHVLRDIYSPKKGQSTSVDLLSTKRFDKELVDWKLGLPRALRFDLGHAFEKVVAFKRQRNILAIKFHHLRALIHRPYLYYPLLGHSELASTALPEIDWPLVSFYERTCISEARETARLLHNISTEKEFVYDFPWWQMISCLICASSILFVSSIFTKPNDETRADFDTAGLYDDAQTCLHVFDALSSNSTGAKIARDMMDCLKEYGLKWREAMGFAPPTSRQRGEPADTLIPQSLHATNAPVTINASDCTSLEDQGISLSEGFMFASDEWPAEIVDSMTWSSQFFGPIQDS